MSSITSTAELEDKLSRGDKLTFMLLTEGQATSTPAFDYFCQMMDTRARLCAVAQVVGSFEDQYQQWLQTGDKGTGMVLVPFSIHLEEGQ